MKTQLLLTIEPQDTERCGECKGWIKPPMTRCYFAQSVSEIDRNTGNYVASLVRGPKCLAAERKLRALVEAGELMRGIIDASNAASKVGCDPALAAWDRAKAEIETE